MPLVVPDVHGEIRMLQYIMGIAASDAKTIRLFRNDLTPVDGSTLTAFSEVTSAGYASQVMSNGTVGWTVSQSGGTTTALHSAITFTFTTDAVVYGYYILNGSNELLWAERFSTAPFSLPDSGGSITISPRISLA